MMNTMFIIRDQRALVRSLRNAPVPTFQWVNAQDTYHRMDEIDGENDPEDFDKQRPSYYLPRVPTPELRLDYSNFKLDMFFSGWWTVSKRMLAALALGDHDAVIRPVDVTGAPRPTELEYAAIAPTHHVDGIDPERSDIYEINDRNDPGYYWRLDSRDGKYPRVALRPGLRAAAPLFYMERTDWLMISAEAAARVRAAGITNVFFDEPGPRYGSWMRGPP